MLEAVWRGHELLHGHTRLDHVLEKEVGQVGVGIGEGRKGDALDDPSLGWYLEVLPGLYQAAAGIDLGPSLCEPFWGFGVVIPTLDVYSGHGYPWEGFKR